MARSGDPTHVRHRHAFDGGDCFFAAPVAVSEREAILDGYSSDGSLAPFKALDSQFHRDFGFGAFIGKAVSRS
jgi:hypothetical protein